MEVNGEKREVKEKLDIIFISEEIIKDRVYEIRGQKVMLDFDLAEIYGYTTKRFNEQVKNNIVRFDEDFMFQLTKYEMEVISRSKKSTLKQEEGRGHNIKYLPHAFTEQGIYMLMTVLKGDFAIAQSKALIRTFKRMKDFVVENERLVSWREYLQQLSVKVYDNMHDTLELRKALDVVENQMSEVMEQLGEAVMKADLSEIMTGFEEYKLKQGYLLFNGQPLEADIIYSQIYSVAKVTIYVIDNYIGIRTLALLKNAPIGVSIILFSDNVCYNKLHAAEFNDFCKEYPDCNISLRHTGKIYHDRYIILDYGTENEKVFLCGASSKDVGAKVSSIVEDFDTEKYHSIVDDLLNNEELKLS